MARVCLACAHPDRQMIEDWIRLGVIEVEGVRIASGSALIALLKDRHPNVRPPTEPTLSRHRRHLTRSGPNAYAVLYEDGKIHDLEGHEIAWIPISVGLKIAFALGIDNMLRDPNTITPRDVIAVAQLMRKSGDGDPVDEFVDAWVRAVRSRGNRASIENPPALPAPEDEEDA